MAKLLFALWLCVFLVETFSASIKTRGKPSLVHVHVSSVEHSFESWGSLNSNFLQVNCPCPSSYEPTNMRGAFSVVVSWAFAEGVVIAVCARFGRVTYACAGQILPLALLFLSIPCTC